MSDGKGLVAAAAIRPGLAGVLSARRGTDRVLYRIDDNERTVTVLRIDHCSDVHGRS